jgi:hypothetical protein
MTAPRRRITPEHAALLEQARSFLADADTRYGPLLDAVVDAVRAFLDAVRAAVLGRTDAAPDPDQFPTEAVWLDIAHAHLDPLIGEAFEAAYMAALDQAADPEVTDRDVFRAEPFVKHHIDTVDSRLRDWPAAVFEEIRHELREAYNGNETTDQMRDRVGAVLKLDAASRKLRNQIDRVRRDIDAAPDRETARKLRAEHAELWHQLREEDRLWWWRANRIARTELTAAVNGGQYRAHITLAAAEGAEPRKQWMATSDERTRPSHAAANGQIQDLSRPFMIGGAPLMYPGDPAGPAAETVNCRCALVVVPPGMDPVPLYPVGDVTDEAGALAATAERRQTMPADVMHATGGNPSAVLIRARQTAEQPTALPAPPRPVPDGWRGVLVPLETLSCDGRVVAAPTGELQTRPMPLPLLAQEQLAPGHDGAVVVGLIDRAWVQDGAVWGEGRFDLQDEAGRLWARRLGDGFAGWVSVDLDEATVTEMGVDDHGNLYELAQADPMGGPDDDQQVVLRADPWRLMSATLLSQQAFTDARITGLTGYSGPGTGTEIMQAAAPPPPQHPRDGADDGQDEVWVPSVGDRVIVDAGDAAGPGEVTEVDTQADPVMVTVVLDAGGQVTVDVAEVAPEAATPPVTDQAGLIRSASGRTRLVRSLAAAGTLLPRAEWFAEPRLDAPTPLTVDGNRVFGHLALWSSCHTGMPDVCVSPPPSGSNYSVFHTGEVLCEGGNLVPVGKITLGGGHADMQDGFQAALEHYDNTGTAVAVVRAYEDEHGIVVAGALCPGVTDHEVAALRRSPLSGDWRRIGGHMELVAALCVNVPGFPVPRLAASIGEMGAQTSLVAAGRVPVGPARVGVTPNLADLVLDSDRYARMVASEALDQYVSRTQRRDAAVARMAANTGTVWGRTRAAVAAARLRGDGTEHMIERAAAGHGYRTEERS